MRIRLELIATHILKYPLLRIKVLELPIYHVPVSPSHVDHTQPNLWYSTEQGHSPFGRLSAPVGPTHGRQDKRSSGLHLRYLQFRAVAPAQGRSPFDRLSVLVGPTHDCFGDRSSGLSPLNHQELHKAHVEDSTHSHKGPPTGPSTGFPHPTVRAPAKRPLANTGDT